MQHTDKPRPVASRRIKIILGVSLALNLAVGGLVAGAALRHGERGPGGPRGAGFGAYGLPYMIALPPEDRRAVSDAVRQGRDAGVPDRAARRALYLDVVSALRATPFDATALAAALGKQTATTLEVQKSAQEAWLGVVTDMSPDARAAYAQAVEEVLRRGPKRRD
ncbi:periplasmic heavy metal sensor [Roseobacter sp.]|uniref:periplasmic heavy metal sensor n=1 Tax=Roseobacter sp. TaxID=1907202 RepID=UPI003296DC8E